MANNVQANPAREHKLGRSFRYDRIVDGDDSVSTETTCDASPREDFMSDFSFEFPVCVVAISTFISMDH